MIKKILLTLVAIVLVGAMLLYFVGIRPTYAPEGCTYELDIAKLRALAASVPGNKPTEIRVEDVTGVEFPRAIVCPGESWDKAQFRAYAYQLVFDDKTIIVDTAMNAAQAKTLGMTEGFDEAAWERVAKGLAQASAIYVTHEHADHMGGAFADDKWAGSLRLNPQQLDSTIMNRPEISAAARAAAKRIGADHYQAVAPGVVVIEAAGHTPGSQMIYVARADGTEVIFTGDTAWLADNIDHQQGPAKVVLAAMGSNRPALSCQLAALDHLQKTEPKVAIMPGHDKARMSELVARGVFKPTFK
ncbi:MAG: MBL fold metallo-hydrolase [Deltaproteobacteria bacterium]|nr:MBL fold metallo-hydrolase [Deltaproteobacteria bacterium]